MRPAPAPSTLTTLATLSFSLALTACGASTRPDGVVPFTPPHGVTCSRTLAASTSASLTDALGRAAAGDCVVAEPGDYGGEFTVPAGVKLLGRTPGTAHLASDAGTAPVLRVNGAEGSGVYGVAVTGNDRGGIQVLGSPATLSQVSVRDAQMGVWMECPNGQTCDGVVTLAELELEHNGSGLAISGVAATASNVGVHRSNDDIYHVLATGIGVSVRDGARLTATDLVVDGSSQAGLIVDGERGPTRVQLERATIRDNRQFGMVVLNLSGTLADPRFTLAASLIERNAGSGLTLSSANGVVVSGTTVRETRKLPVVISLGHTEWVGDGVAIIKGSGEVRLDDVTLEGNLRCQAIVDNGRDGISFVNPHVATDGGQYLIVVQNSRPVNVPPEVVSDAGVDQLGVN